jgi:ParB family chromosome partitioning protein
MRLARGLITPNQLFLAEPLLSRRSLSLTELLRAHGGLAVDMRKTLCMEIRRIKRHRREMRDLAGLAESIERIGLLHPIIVTPQNLLIAGERRLAAAQLLGWDDVPARVVDIEHLVIREQAENIDRLDFAVAERVAIGAAIEELLGSRQGRRTDLGRLRENFPEVEPGERTRKLAALVSRNDETYEQAKAVVAAGGKPLLDMNPNRPCPWPIQAG